MSSNIRLQNVTLPIVAILRGVRPDEAVDIGAALLDAGVRIIEVPLNSPQPLASIERLTAAFGKRALLGAGTVLSVEDVDEVAAAGGRLIVSPNTDRAVIEQAIERGLDVLPGFTTPTEALVAIASGARDLKLFPAGSIGPAHLRALREVLPADSRVWAVGGVDASNLGQWLHAGASGVGIGGSLYRPGSSALAVRESAVKLVTAWRASEAQRAAPHPGSASGQNNRQ
ncbi:MAG: 2-dehydro-3-deoxy-6-phosphogalactonate aldolase [Steroidobacteraceae bacterium]